MLSLSRWVKLQSLCLFMNNHKAWDHWIYSKHNKSLLFCLVTLPCLYLNTAVTVLLWSSIYLKPNIYVLTIMHSTMHDENKMQQMQHISCQTQLSRSFGLAVCHRSWAPCCPYASTLNVRPSVLQQNLGPNLVIQLDNDPKHSSKSTAEWLKKRKESKCCNDTVKVQTSTWLKCCCETWTTLPINEWLQM